ncbi:hypothetical protein GS399_07250 [Pedobacter sp. HMF7647]|uniref:DUF2281 domain-containing protein n=1 Tax=Hufsiella arboris TaxID=2695275 RepID=A0A7K1Y856_9SPHI|nr:hypothetical protein [Hufsiella arboris]MXV50765.1 hypothetical protein [Hufsiella arboris]
MNFEVLTYKINQLSDEKKKEVEALVNNLLAEEKVEYLRKAGFAKGTFEMKPGFDDLVEGFDE